MREIWRKDGHRRTRKIYCRRDFLPKGATLAFSELRIEVIGEIPAEAPRGLQLFGGNVPDSAGKV